MSRTPWVGTWAVASAPPGLYESNSLEDFEHRPIGLFLAASGSDVTDLLHDLHVGQRGHVAQLASLGHITEQAAHDLPGTSLRQILGEDDRMGPGDLADHLGHVFP